MKKHIEELYQQAKRFDECGLYQSQQYSDICKRQLTLSQEMRLIFGPMLGQLLDEYTAAIGDECDLECRHFFEQGFLLGKDSSK